MLARWHRDVLPLALSPRAATERLSRGAAREGALEHDAGMPHLVRTRGRLENESAVADIDVTRHFVRHSIVTSHEIRTHRLVVLERYQPVRVLRFRPGIAEFRELPVPGRIRYLHSKLVGKLA